MGARTIVRRICYAAFPIATVLIVPGLWLMPNRHYAGPVLEADPWFQLGFLLAFAGVALASTAMLILVLAAED